MNRLVIFNVGGALSSYLEIGGKKAIIDLGKSGKFSPVNDFLLPLFKINNYGKNSGNKYIVDQLFLSHLDSDHILDYLEFKKYFYPSYLTCPNKHPKQDCLFNVNEKLLGTNNEIRNVILKDMTDEGKRTPPLKVCNELKNNILMFSIPPKVCEGNDELLLHYPNNISLSLFVSYRNLIVYFPGDIQKEGMDFLIKHNHDFKSLIKANKVNILVAPHHGLSTSFPDCFFENIKGRKVDLIIISEKIRTDDSQENRSDVDSRYYSSKYSSGKNSLQQYGVKTSGGHIYIDLDSCEVAQFQDINEIIRLFKV